ncbi:HYDIN protein, partial [Origma solitaria]|nr:HYDIN protein [Origma solitaria]
LINKGPIDAPFAYLCSGTKINSCFKCEPKEGTIATGGSQTVQISFNAAIVGPFSEHLHIAVPGCPTPLFVTVKGHVCAATLDFAAPELCFDDVSFGFPKTMSIRLTNNTPAFFNYKLRVTGDGQERVVTGHEQITKENDESWKKGIQCHVEPQEFTVTPSEGSMYPFAYDNIQITLCSNTVMEYCRKLVVDLEGIGEAVSSLTITARCLVPKLQVYPNILWYDNSCLNTPYEKTFLIVNTTHLRGCYGLIPQKRNEDSPVFYSSCKPCGMIEPFGVEELPLTVEAKKMGKHSTTLL